MKKAITLILALMMVFSLVACSGGSSSSGSSAQKVSITLGHTNNTEHHYHKLSENFKKYVEEAANGSIEVNVFPAEQLGSGQAMLESVKSGTQDIVLDPDAYLANYNNLFNVFSLAYQFDNWDKVEAFLTSEARTVLEKAAEDSGFVILGWTANGFRYFTTVKEIKSVADLKGIKLRTGSNDLVIKLYSALGCAPTSLSMSDTYNGISTHIVDGQENSLANIIGNKFYEVAPYLTLTRHIYTWEPLIMSKATWDKLTPDQQKVLKEAGEKACAEDFEFCKASEADDLKTIENGGGIICEVNTDEFKALMEPVNEDYVAGQDDAFKTLYELIKGL